MNLYCNTAGQVYYDSPQEEVSQLLERKPPASAALAPPEPKPLNPAWITAVRAAEDKKAENIKVFDLRGVATFADLFIICTSSNARQGHAIIEEIESQLKQEGERPISVEGKESGEWILADYGDFLIHVFSPKSRTYFDLERLYRDAKIVPIPGE
jgi:ribosome-associated protein